MDLKRPECLTHHMWDPIQVNCPYCEKCVRIEDSISDSNNNNYCNCVLQLEKIREINQKIKTEMWQKVLLNYSTSSNSGSVFSIMNPDIANWKFFLPITNKSNILELGAGFGAITSVLAHQCKHIIAIDSVKERAEFMIRRFKQDGIENVTVLNKAPYEIPMLLRQTNIVIVNELYGSEIIEKSLKKRKFKMLQFYKALFENLTKDGYMIVSFKNCFSLSQIKRFSRLLADSKTKNVARSLLKYKMGNLDILGNTFMRSLSLRINKTLLKEAGFKDLKILCPLPNYNNPKFLIPYDDTLFAYHRKHFNSSHNKIIRQKILLLMAVLGIEKHIVDSYIIICRK